MKSFIAKFFAVLALVSAVTAFTEHADAKPRRLKALVVSGQNNHNWPVSHKVLERILEQSGLFEVDIALTASAGGDMSGFKPDFAAYDVVVLDYNGDRWPAETDAAFLDYVQGGGGVVVYSLSSTIRLARAVRTARSASMRCTAAMPSTP